MRKVNFNQLKNIKTPDSWIENAMLIPEKKNAPRFSFSKGYTAAFAVTVVFCCTVAAIIALNFGNDEVIPKTPSTTGFATQQTVSSDYYDPDSDYSDNSNGNAQGSHGNNNGRNTQSSDGYVYSTDPAEGTVRNTGSTQDGSRTSTEPTESESKNSTPSSKISRDNNKTEPATNQPNSSAGKTTPAVTEPYETQGGEDKPPQTSPTVYVRNDFEPEQGKYDVYSAYNCIGPGEAGEPFEPSAAEPGGWDVATSPSAETEPSSAPVPSSNYFSGNVVLQCTNFDFFNSDSEIYCTIERKYGRRTQKSEQGVCKVTRYDNCVVAEYNPTASLSKDVYEITFYDDSGNQITTDVYLSDKDILIVY